GLRLGGGGGRLGLEGVLDAVGRAGLAVGGDDQLAGSFLVGHGGPAPNGRWPYCRSDVSFRRSRPPGAGRRPARPSEAAPASRGPPAPRSPPGPRPLEAPHGPRRATRRPRARPPPSRPAQPRADG